MTKVAPFLLLFIFGNALAADAPPSTEVLQLRAQNIEMQMHQLERDTMVQQYIQLDSLRKQIIDEIAKRGAPPKPEPKEQNGPDKK